MIKEPKNCECRYKLIYLDCNMPEMDGYTTCKLIRELERNKEISAVNVVAVTADVTPYNLKKCFDFHFDDVITKPIINEKLKITLERYLK